MLPAQRGESLPNRKGESPYDKSVLWGVARPTRRVVAPPQVASENRHPAWQKISDFLAREQTCEDYIHTGLLRTRMESMEIGNFNFKVYSIGMLHDYAVRITYSYDQAAPIVRAWATRVTKMVVYEHIGSQTEKKHIHLLVLGSSLQKKQLRNIASQLMDVKGNEIMSFKEYVGGEDYMTYMTKGKHDPSYLQGYTAEEAAVWKSKWVEPARHEKVSSDERLYEDVFGGDYPNEHWEMWKKEYPEKMKFDWVREFARSLVFQRNKFIWNLKAINQYKMLVYTYCYRNGVAMLDLKKTGIWKDW